MLKYLCPKTQHGLEPFSSAPRGERDNLYFRHCSTTTSALTGWYTGTSLWYKHFPSSIFTRLAASLPLLPAHGLSTPVPQQSLLPSSRHYAHYRHRSPYSQRSALRPGPHGGAAALRAGGIAPAAEPGPAPLQLPCSPVTRELLPARVSLARGSSLPAGDRRPLGPLRRRLPSASPTRRSPAPAPGPPSPPHRPVDPAILSKPPPPVRARTPRASLPPSAARHFPPGKGGAGARPRGRRGAGPERGRGRARSAGPAPAAAEERGATGHPRCGAPRL